MASFYTGAWWVQPHNTMKPNFEEVEGHEQPNKGSTLPAVPHDVIPVPTGEISYTDAAKIIFPVMGEKRLLFMRGRTPHEIALGEQEKDILIPASPERFCNQIESMGMRVARRENGTGEMAGKPVWRTTTFPVSSVKVLFRSDAAAEHLPPIRQLANCPILTASGEVLAKGYHDHAGGTYISQGREPDHVPLEVAKNALMELLVGFAFVTESDRSRALASLISPALKMGGHIVDDFPVDVAEANLSQSGKTYRLKLVPRLYAELPSAVTSAKGGVGSVDELIAGALIKGRPFIILDNFRGRLDSTILEEAIRGVGWLTCRAFKSCAEVDTSPFIWQISTNGAEFTRDLANRAIITRIRKHADGHVFKTFPTGDLLSHVEANQTFYLGAIFSVIREWMKNGCPKTDESRHDFRGWCQVMDWIVQTIFQMPPLLDGHREEQARTANPALKWLRDVCHAANASKQLGRDLNTSELARIADDAGVEFPGNPASQEKPAPRAGKLLGRLFRESNGKPVSVDGYTVTCREDTNYGNGAEIQKVYTIDG